MMAVGMVSQSSMVVAFFQLISEAAVYAGNLKEEANKGLINKNKICLGNLTGDTDFDDFPIYSECYKMICVLISNCHKLRQANRRLRDLQN